jgi:hypothetical protein
MGTPVQKPLELTNAPRPPSFVSTIAVGFSRPAVIECHLGASVRLPGQSESCAWSVCPELAHLVHTHTDCGPAAGPDVPLPARCLSRLFAGCCQLVPGVRPGSRLGS